MIGVPLGVLISVITGILVILIISLAANGRPNASTLSVISTALLAIPTFWFGGPWITTLFMREIVLADIVQSYVITLAICFTGFAMFPMIRYIIVMGKRIGAAEPHGGGQ